MGREFWGEVWIDNSILYIIDGYEPPEEAWRPEYRRRVSSLGERSFE